MDQRYGDYLEAGYEGQMIRENAEYEQNKRSKSLIKRKEFLTDEFHVIAVEEGKGNWAGYIKRFILQLPDGREFGAVVRGTQEVMKKLFESNEKPTWATLRYFTPTPDGVPRFPVVVDWGVGQRED
jgi:DNA ligase-1